MSEHHHHHHHHHHSSSSITATTTPPAAGATKKKDPTSHRIIEKRRRDRMNNCLGSLCKLIPTRYFKKGPGRVEKTEIVETAIKYMKDLMTEYCALLEIAAIRREHVLARLERRFSNLNTATSIGGELENDSNYLGEADLMFYRHVHNVIDLPNPLRISIGAKLASSKCSIDNLSSSLENVNSNGHDEADDRDVDVNVELDIDVESQQQQAKHDNKSNDGQCDNNDKQAGNNKKSNRKYDTDENDINNCDDAEKHSNRLYSGSSSTSVSNNNINNDSGSSSGSDLEGLDSNSDNRSKGSSSFASSSNNSSSSGSPTSSSNSMSEKQLNAPSHKQQVKRTFSANSSASTYSTSAMSTCNSSSNDPNDNYVDSSPKASGSPSAMSADSELNLRLSKPINDDKSKNDNTVANSNRCANGAADNTNAVEKSVNNNDGASSTISFNISSNAGHQLLQSRPTPRRRHQPTNSSSKLNNSCLEPIPSKILVQQQHHYNLQRPQTSPFSSSGNLGDIVDNHADLGSNKHKTFHHVESHQVGQLPFYNHNLSNQTNGSNCILLYNQINESSSGNGNSINSNLVVPSNSNMNDANINNSQNNSSIGKSVCSDNTSINRNNSPGSNSNTTNSNNSAGWYKKAWLERSVSKSA